MSNDKRDLGEDRSIFVNTHPHINPSVQKVRHFFSAKEGQFASAIEGYNTVVIVSNLAGTAGAAMAPAACAIASRSATVISFAIMPFGFEKERHFAAGVALRRVRAASHSTIVADNGALSDNNPDLSFEECISLLNSALADVAASVAAKGAGPDMNILATGRASRGDEPLRDPLSMLFSGATEIGRAVVYVMGGDKLSLGALDDIASCARGVFGQDGATEVLLSVEPAGGSAQTRVHVVASAPSKTRFDRYDPLGEVIPADSHLDWDEPDSAPEMGLAAVAAAVAIPAME